jgi:hypothetical protein
VRDCPVWDISGKARMEGLPSIVNGESAVPECCETCLQLARIVKRGVEAGKTVEIMHDIRFHYFFSLDFFNPISLACLS